MSLGLTNEPAAFIYLMNKVFQNFLGSFVTVFIDDILVYSKNEGDHRSHLRMVLRILKEHQSFSIYIKCEFFLRSEFLGHIITSERVEVDLRKMGAVKNWPGH